MLAINSLAIRGWLCAALGSIVLITGCAQNSQLAKLQSEKQQLASLVAQEKERANLIASQLEKERARAAEAERELALLHDGSNDTQFASLKSNAHSQRFESWARKQAGLKYDAVRQVARLPLKIEFNGDDRLTFSARRELDKLADLLLTPEADRYGARIWSEAPSANDTNTQRRMNAVSEYLRQRGVAHQRLETAHRKAGSLTDEDGRPTSLPSTKLEFEIFELTGASRTQVADEPAENGWTSKQRR